MDRERQTGVLKTAGTDSITATDTVNPSITGTGFFTVQPGPATHMGLTAPSSAYVGSPISYTLTAYDLFGNVATSYGGTVAFTSSDPGAVLPGSSAITNGTGTFSATMETVGSQTITATDAGNSLTGQTGTIAVTVPNLVVTTAVDDAGSSSNCTIQTTPGTGTDASCSLRDALLFASTEGSGGITFDSTKFGSGATIELGYGTLTLPANTTVTGLTTGSGPSLMNLVTITANGTTTDFTVNSGTTGAAIANLIVTGGSSGGNGGGISNAGTLAIAQSTISANSAAGGGGISNTGTLTITGSTISGNTASSSGGGGINNNGTLTIIGSTLSGDADSGNVGGAIYNAAGTLTLTDSTISGNSASSGGGIFTNGPLIVANSVVAGNAASTSYADIEVYLGTLTDLGGNVDGTNVSTSSTINPQLATLSNYGGALQTMIPLPGSPAICAGTAGNIPSGVIADERGEPNSNSTYGPATCVDSGAVQTNYSMVFSTEPAPISPATLFLPNTNFAAAVTLDESGNPFTPAVNIPLSLNGIGTLANGTATTASGVATYSTLQVSAPGTGDTLTATLALNPAIVSNSPAVSATSSPGFTVIQTATTTSAASASANYSPGAQSVALSATVTNTATTVDAGTVTFTLLAGSTPVGSPVISGTVTNGAASASYTLPGGTTVGSYTIQAVYSGVSGSFLTSSDSSQTLTIGQATPPIIWRRPDSITYGTPLGSLQLSAHSTVAGTMAFTPPAGTILTAGSQTLSATFTPTDTTDYTTATDSVPLWVMKEKQVVTWPTPAPITYGTAVGAAQLNATASVAGAFTYEQPAGWVPTAGDHTLTVTFVPDDTTDYPNSVVTTVTLTVNPAVLTVTASNKARIYGTPNPATFPYTITGFVRGQDVSVVSGSPSLTTTATESSLAGTYPITPTIGTLAAENYTFSFASGTLTINQATPVITWATPAPITAGTAIGPTQQNATTSVPGTFTYTQPAGWVPRAGTHTLTVTFTPTDATDYKSVTATVTLTVESTTVSWGRAGFWCLQPMPLGRIPGGESQTLCHFGRRDNEIRAWPVRSLRRIFCHCTRIFERRPATSALAWSR